MDAKVERDPRRHTAAMKAHLEELTTHLLPDVDKVDEPQLKAMFETSAEAPGGLVKAYSDYEKKNESAWRGSRASGAGAP